MSPWATDSNPVTDSPATPAPRHWILVFPFFVSALFFLSAFFSVFSPLPLLFLYFRSGRKLAWLAVLSNAALVLALGGRASLLLYLVFVVALVLPLAELFRARLRLELSVFITLLFMGAAGFAVLLGYAHLHHLAPATELRNQVSRLVDLFVQSRATGTENAVSAEDLAEWKAGMILEFPSAIAVFALVLIWANTTMLLRANPAALRERLRLAPTFLREWKAPEWLVWPTVASGVFLLWEVPGVSGVAFNLFKLFMAIYAIQGLSVLSYFFDLWGVRGFFRTAGYLISILVMMPLLLGLGFFDLWFDFRAKFRQKT